MFCFISLLPDWVLSSICVPWDGESAAQVLSPSASSLDLASPVFNNLFWISKYLVEKCVTKFRSHYQGLSSSWDILSFPWLLPWVWYFDEMSFIYFQLSQFFSAGCLCYLTVTSAIWLLQVSSPRLFFWNKFYVIGVFILPFQSISVLCQNYKQNLISIFGNCILICSC